MRNFTLTLAYILICLTLSAQTASSESNKNEQNDSASWNIPGMNQNAVMSTDLGWPDDLFTETKTSRAYAEHGFIESAGWTGLSTYVIPDDPDLESIFSARTDKIDMLYNFDGKYVPSAGINTLGEWDPWSGYIAKFNDVISFSFSGQLNLNREVTLDIGWNLMPILAPCDVDVDSIFAALDVVLVKQVAGYRLYWPDMSINTLQTLSPGKAYFVLMNSPGTITFPDCMPQPWECGETFIDYRDGKSYSTVQIGAQCWMAENLNIGTRINGNNPQTDNASIEKYCYNNDESNCNKYGGLYQWDEVMAYSNSTGTQGICPEGWYLPTDTEWTALAELLGGGTVAGGKLKQSGFLHWSAPNTGATNSSGFTGLPGGNRSIDGSFSNHKFYGNFWTSTGFYNNTSYRRYLTFTQAAITRDFIDINMGLSVRCRKAEFIDLDIVPANPSVGCDAGSTLLRVYSNTAWTVEESIPWLTVTPLSGNNDGALVVAYELNEGDEPRSGEITLTAAGGVPTVTVLFTQAKFEWSCGYPIEDERDGKFYNTVLIGDQCWLAESLNIGQVVNQTQDQADNGIIEKYCVDNDSTNCDIYGGLYQWDEMMQYANGVGLKGICPAGWHLPSATEWHNLINGLGGPDVAGGKMKTTGTIEDGTGLWYAPNTGATNSSGFSAEPAGYRTTEGSIDLVGYLNNYWTAGLLADTLKTGVINSGSDAIPFEIDRKIGYSIRCLQDEPSHTFTTAYPARQDVSVEAGELTFTINSNTDWTIENNDDWLTISPENGNGNGEFTVSYQNNILEEERTATLSIISGEESFEVYIKQEAFVPQLTVDPMIVTIYDSEEGTFELIVSSNLSWMVIENVSWFSISPATGMGNDTLILSYEQNPSTDLRIGQFFIMGMEGDPMLTITVTQSVIFLCGNSFDDFRDSQS